MHRVVTKPAGRSDQASRARIAGASRMAVEVAGFPGQEGTGAGLHKTRDDLTYIIKVLLLMGDGEWQVAGNGRRGQRAQRGSAVSGTVASSLWFCTFPRSLARPLRLTVAFR